MDVAIIGAGFGGLLVGARLRELGVQNIRLIDKAADVGGTWYWNRYPGIACDVESYVYMPLLEELGYIPTEKYAKGPEIFAHCKRIDLLGQPARVLNALGAKHFGGRRIGDVDVFAGRGHLPVQQLVDAPHRPDFTE